MSIAAVPALVELLYFVTAADDETVHPDAAIAELELATHLLSQLPAKDKDALVEYIRALSQEAEAGGDIRRARVLTALPRELGLTAWAETQAE